MKNGVSKTRPQLDPVSEESERLRSKFIVYGQEALGRKVHKCGGSGRIYLPREWLGKTVKVIRED